jgi:hypothetical protein
MIHVSFCCNDDYGNFKGSAWRISFSEYELDVEENLWPPHGVGLKFDETMRADQSGRLKVGRDIWRPYAGRCGGGNIYWQMVRMAGIDAIGIMNYLMRLKHWHAEGGECYLFDQFNAKQLIDPRTFFATRNA